MLITLQGVDAGPVAPLTILPDNNADMLLPLAGHVDVSQFFNLQHQRHLAAENKSSARRRA